MLDRSRWHDLGGRRRRERCPEIWNDCDGAGCDEQVGGCDWTLLWGAWGLELWAGSQKGGEQPRRAANGCALGIRRGENRKHKICRFRLLDLVRERALSMDGRVLRRGYLDTRDLNRRAMGLVGGEFEAIVTGVLGISESGLIGPDRIA